MISENKLATGCFFLGTENSYEDFIEIIVREEIEIYEVHRSDRMLIIKLHDKVQVGVYASILWLRMFKPRINNVKINEIYHYAELREVKLLDDFIFDSLNSEYYLIGHEDEKKICLIKENDMYSLKYFHKNIIDNADMTQGYIALFNYTLMLEFISNLYNNLICVIDKSVNKDAVIFLYLFGKGMAL